MKTFLSIVGLIVVIGLAFYVFGNTADAPADRPAEDESATSTTEDLAVVAAGTYSVSTSSSEVTWQARKPLVENYVDSGFVPVSSGEVTVDADGVSGGSVTFDVANIEATSVSNQNAGAEQLTGHLRSDDFLAVDEFPTGEFTVTSATAASGTNAFEITGDLTLKDETNEISFPATVGMNEAGELVLEGSTTIDRSRWNIRYGSDSFFDNLGDNLIADEVEIEMSLVATPAE